MKKSNKIKSLALIGAMACFGFVSLVSAPTFAINCGDGWTSDPTGTTCIKKDPPSGDLWGVINTVINVILAIVGVIAVFMIILGGIQYSTSAGDPGKVKKAKDTILYGVIGLVIALLAFAIVNFVLTNVFSGNNS